MDSELSSVFNDMDDESDGFTPEAKPKAKAPVKKTATTKAASKPAAKKMVQTTLKAKPGPKKRAKPDSDNEDDVSGFSNTPPSAKKQKKAPAKKSSGKPLVEIENDSLMQLDGPSESKPNTKKTHSETYQKLTQLEHIIKRPDTYIGSVERTEQQMWIYNKETSLMENRKVSFVPGFYKIFDEILVNAADNSQREAGMTMLKVTVDRENGEIVVENNGKGIPVVVHEKEGIYIPELVFGHLLSGSNYDDTEQKTVGGRNGFGAKLCNVFSTEFTLETQDAANGKRYKQTWRNNMSKVEKAKITSNKTADFVRVSFKPDFKRFGMDEGIDNDMEALINRRVYDMAGTLKGIKVYLNGSHLKIAFKEYCGMYAKAIALERDEGDEATTTPATVLFEDKNAHARWQVAFTVSDGSFQQVSFVNSIATTMGGTHVNYIADQICQFLLKKLDKTKKGHSLKPVHVRNHIFIFVNCLINNPSFTSQTKEQLTTKQSAFGSKAVLTEKFLKDIAKTDALNNIIHFADKKADKMMSKSDGTKRSRISDAKLVDANLAGTRRGHECTLILTEGDSARGLAVAGRAILDPDRIGVFPLRGKMLNVRDASIDQITKNKEIQNIKQFLGLKHKQTYTDTKGLRYGHLMIMADQDHDGSHIKGLLINFLQLQFPSLLQIPDFFREFVTPVVKVWQGKDPKKPLRLKSFFTIPQYEEWKEAHTQEIRKWDYKYFKGLGTSTNEDAQVYFTNLDEHLKEFHTMKPDEADMFDLAFSKKKADARKEWLGNFIPGTYLDHSTKKITYGDFVNRELILFSMADNLRSIPSVLDGFKPGQRKVLYACLKRNLLKDMKVSDLSGYVSEQTSYHHGDVSLNMTIVGLAQNFVGSNNINCLEPSGNFGSRLSGGSDAASARYIYTRLSPFARRIFSPLDEPNLEHHVEDGKKIEPKVYCPVIPMVLVNGADGIGTGWSTNIPNYHPMDIIKNIKRRMGRLEGEDDEEKPFAPMMPWFRGWKGTPAPEPDAPNKFRFNGIAKQDEMNPNEVVITELPIRMWTDDFKARLEDVIRAEKVPSYIKDYKEFNDHKNVHFIIQLEDKHMRSALEEGLLERFKLLKTVNTTNLVAFDTNGQIRKYEKVEDIMEEFYVYRLAMYTERKVHWLKVHHADYRKLMNQARFIKEIIDGKLVVSKKRKAVLVQELRDRKYEAFPKGDDGKKKNSDEEMGGVNEDDDDSEGSASDYDYLLSMPIWSLTLERLERLEKAIAAKKAEYDELESMSEKDLWCKDLDEIIEEWERQLVLDAEVQTTIRRMGRRVSKKIGAGTGKGRKPKGDDEYEPVKAGRGAKTAKPAKPVKVEAKTHQRFAEMFSSTKPKAAKAGTGHDGVDDSDGLSDDDFVSLSKPKKATAKTQKGQVKVEEPENALESAEEIVERPSRRAATTKAKKWVISDDESDLDDDKMLGDVGAMVKGIGQPAADTTTGRVSLFAMSRPESSGGGGSGSGSGGASTDLPKTKTKPTKTFDFDDSQDETNYEMLARSSPQKPTHQPVADEVDSFLSDDDVPPVKAKSALPSKASQSSAAHKAAASTAAPAAKKARGRPAAGAGAKGKGKGKDDKEPAPAKTKAKAAPGLSPAAKAYGAKKVAVTKAASKKVKDPFDDLDSESGEVMADPDSPPPRAAARGRPGRAAAAKAKAKPIYLDDDGDDDDDDPLVENDDDDGSDAFDMDESD